MSPLRGPKIRFPPPAVYVALFLLALILESVARLPLHADRAGAHLLDLLGVALVIAGAVMMLWGIATFWRARTTILPFEPASALVRHGPYRFTRNPMYVGMTVAYVGAAFAMNVAWPFVVLPVAIWVIQRYVIRPEEEYLERTFGADYAEFRARVRRWI